MARTIQFFLHIFLLAVAHWSNIRIWTSVYVEQFAMEIFFNIIYVETICILVSFVINGIFTGYILTWNLMQTSKSQKKKYNQFGPNNFHMRAKLSQISDKMQKESTQNNYRMMKYSNCSMWSIQIFVLNCLFQRCAPLKCDWRLVAVSMFGDVRAD